jgi:hypothetical protein
METHYLPYIRVGIVRSKISRLYVFARQLPEN